MRIQRFQAGGEMSAAQEQQQGGGDPMNQIIPAMAQAVQAGDCQTLMQVCTDFLQLVSSAAGGPQQQAQPTFARKGGRITRI